jgi:hypothetical protein
MNAGLMPRPRLLLALAVSLAAWTLTARATTIVPLDLAELSVRARAIARGEVVDIRSEWAPGRRGVQTRVTIAVAEYLKGQLGSHVTLVVPGGRIGRYRSILVGAPRFESGQSVVVFLIWSDPSQPYLVGFSQGVFRVVRAASGAEVVTPPPLVAGSAPQVVKRGDPDRPALGIAEFRSLVRSLVSEPAR